MDFFWGVYMEIQGPHFSVHSRRTHNPLNGEFVDPLAGMSPEELPVLPADLLATRRQKERQKSHLMACQSAVKQGAGYEIRKAALQRIETLG